MKSKDHLFEVKVDLISELNLNFSSKQYKLINAGAQAALNMFHDEAMVTMSESGKTKENTLIHIAQKLEKLQTKC